MDRIKILNLYDKFYKHPYYYLYSMSIYHILIILYSYVFILSYTPKTFYTLSFSIADTTNFFNDGDVLKNIFYTFLIISIDFIFLYILMKEFKSLNLNYFKVILLEIVIILISISHFILRDIMFFLSLNTLQITIVYIIIKKIPFGKQLFLSASYINILILFFYPLYEFIRLILIFSS